MFGIIVGSAAALGACAYLSRRRRRGYRHGSRHGSRYCYGGHRHGSHRCYGGSRGWGRGRDWDEREGPTRERVSAWVARIADRLDATPEQEEVMFDAARSVARQLRELKGSVWAGGREVAEALGSDRFDAEQLGELFGHQDDRLRSAREAVVEALAKVHAVLDPEQRERLARWLGRRREGGGPYRA